MGEGGLEASFKAVKVTCTSVYSSGRQDASDVQKLTVGVKKLLHHVIRGFTPSNQQLWPRPQTQAEFKGSRAAGEG